MLDPIVPGVIVSATTDLPGDGTSSETSNGIDSPIPSDTIVANRCSGIFGFDNRNPISDTQKYPFRAICQLVISGNNKKTIGTGWFAGDNGVITSGDNLYDNDQIGPGWVETVEVWPGRNGKLRWETEVASREQLWVSDEWKKGGSDRRSHNFGVISLTTNIGKRTGYFEPAYWIPQEVHGKAFSVVGYPQQQVGIPASTMWYDVGTIVVGEKTLEYSMDTTAGQSGAPIIAWTNDRILGSMLVVGIHTGNGQGVRITQTVRDAIEQRVSRQP